MSDPESLILFHTSYSSRSKRMSSLLFTSLLVALVSNLETVVSVPQEFGRGQITEDPEVHMNTTQLITSKGYPCEDYDVHTQDGYILGIQRIPGGKTHKDKNFAPKPVVLLQHGLLSCSACWVENLVNESLGFMLADAGFDVWLGNNRGNTYAKRHEHLKPDQKEFWAFSWDEMAEYDLPATVDKILSVTGAQQIFYIGHSQGCEIAIAQLSKDADLARKIKLFVGLAPATYLGHVKSPIRYLAPFAKDIQFLLDILGEEEFLPSDGVLQWLASEVCYRGDIPKFLCENVLFLLGGYDYKEMNASRVPVYVAQHPAGTSVQNVVHYAQAVQSKLYQMFDFGPETNMKKYNQTTPPQYYPSNITIPVALYSGTADWLVAPEDMKILVPQIKKLVRNVVIDGWEHLDFIWALEAPQRCYNDVIKLLKDFK